MGTHAYSYNRNTVHKRIYSCQSLKTCYINSAQTFLFYFSYLIVSVHSCVHAPPHTASQRPICAQQEQPIFIFISCFYCYYFIIFLFCLVTNVCCGCSLKLYLKLHFQGFKEFSLLSQHTFPHDMARNTISEVPGSLSKSPDL